MRDAARRGRRVATMLLTAAGVLAGAAGCGSRPDEISRRDAAALTGGDADRGMAAIRTYGCGSCHTIPGVRGANSKVAPPLAGIASRMYIAGVLTNTPDHLVRWIVDPPAVDSATAMPRTGVTVEEARDIAAYLYTLP